MKLFLKPFPNFHSARMMNPGLFSKIVVLKTTKEGIMFYGGPLKTNPKGSTKVQTIRFPKKNFTVKEAKTWLSDHDYTPISFEPASKSRFDKAIHIDELSVIGHETPTLISLFKYLNNMALDFFADNDETEVIIQKQALVNGCIDIINELETRNVNVTKYADELCKAVWTRAYINDLPDSAFLYVESGGKKDDEDKTKPRSLRHFPYKDSTGKIDLIHLKNALSRIPQSKLPESVKTRVAGAAKKLYDKLTNNKTGKTEKNEKIDEKEFVTVFIKDAEEHIVTGIVYEPDECDTDGDTADAAEIRKACFYFMEKSGSIKMNHKGNKIKATVIENYIAPVKMSIAGRSIKKGTWLMSVKIHDEDVWKAVKDGDLTGFSMAGYCQGVTIEED